MAVKPDNANSFRRDSFRIIPNYKAIKAIGLSLPKKTKPGVEPRRVTGMGVFSGPQITGWNVMVSASSDPHSNNRTTSTVGKVYRSVEILVTTKFTITTPSHRQIISGSGSCPIGRMLL